jgi:hypothetical protein
LTITPLPTEDASPPRSATGRRRRWLAAVVALLSVNLSVEAASFDPIVPVSVAEEEATILATRADAPSRPVAPRRRRRPEHARPGPTMRRWMQAFVDGWQSRSTLIVPLLRRGPPALVA